MLRIRRAPCRSIGFDQRLLKCLFSHHALLQSLPTVTGHDDDVSPWDFTTVGPSSAEPKKADAESGFRKKSDAISPHILLKQLGRSKRDPGKPKAKNYDVETNFSNQFMTPAARIGSEYYKTMEEMRRIEAQALKIGREIARRSKDTPILRRTFWRLFEYCNTARDIIHVLAIAFQTPITTKALEHLSQPIVRALFRARAYATDKRIFTVFYALIHRLEKTGVTVDEIYYSHCAKFAARSRDPVALQRALWLFRSRNVEVKFRTFRAIIAKFSIGINGYGEIRNGRWRRQDLLPALLGFAGTKSGKPKGDQEDHHLGSFLKRNQWQYLASWVQILSHCKATDELWSEWLHWRDGDLRKEGRGITDAAPHMTRERRDEFFIIHMLVAGNNTFAWSILRESKLDFWKLNVRVRTRLFDDVENLDIAASAFGDKVEFKNALLEKYEHDLEFIEDKLGVRWESDGQGGGWHITTEDLEEKLEVLSRPDFGHTYGFFAEEDQEQKDKG